MKMEQSKYSHVYLLKYFYILHMKTFIKNIILFLISPSKVNLQNRSLCIVTWLHFNTGLFIPLPLSEEETNLYIGSVDGRSLV